MMASPKRAHVFWWKDLERWIVPPQQHSAKLPGGWSLVRIGDLVKQVAEKVKVEPDCEYKLAGVRLYGNGMFHRETVKGSESSATFLMPLIPGAFIYNRLFAWKETFAVVPEDLDGCYVSNEFPQFRVNSERVLPHYLFLFCLCKDTIKAVNKASIGSAAVSRNRYKEEYFLNLQIPLPPLSTQRTIVDLWQQAQTELTSLYAQIEVKKKESDSAFLSALGFATKSKGLMPKVFAVNWDDLFTWNGRSTYLALTQGDVHRGRFPVVQGKDCLSSVSHGCSASPSPIPTNLEVLKISAVTRGELKSSEKKFAFDNPAIRKQFDLRKGDVLLCRTNGTLAYVAMSAIVTEDMPNLVFPDKVIRVRVKDNIQPEYFWLVLQTPPLRAQIEAAARTAVGNYAIGGKDIWEFDIPLPPLDVQRSLVDKKLKERSEIDSICEGADRLALKSKAEIETMILGTKKPVSVD